MDLHEALYTTRAMRRVRPDPIPDETIKLMIDAAVRAPTGSNYQGWRLIAVTDSDVKAKLGNLYREAYEVLNSTIYAGQREQFEAAGDMQMMRITRSSDWLAENFEQVPLWVFCYHRNDPSGGSIYPAVWSLMLAARGEGVGTCLTTVLGLFRRDETAEVLSVPSEKGWELAAAVSAGYPTGRWGTAARKPVHLVAFQDRWGEAVPWTAHQPVWLEPEDYGRT